MKTLLVIGSLLWQSIALAGEWTGQAGPVIAWQRDHQQTTNYRSWAADLSYQWSWLPHLKGGLGINGMLFRFPDTSQGVVLGAGPVVTGTWKLGENWFLDVPIGASFAYTDLDERCLEISTDWNAIVHAGGDES